MIKEPTPEHLIAVVSVLWPVGQRRYQDLGGTWPVWAAPPVPGKGCGGALLGKTVLVVETPPTGEMGTWEA